MEAFLVFGVPAGSEGIRGDTRCILKEHKNTLNPQVEKKKKKECSIIYLDGIYWLEARLQTTFKADTKTCMTQRLNTQSLWIGGRSDEATDAPSSDVPYKRGSSCHGGPTSRQSDTCRKVKSLLKRSRHEHLKLLRWARVP